MYKPFDTTASDSLFEDSDRLERGILGYSPFRQICRRCGSSMAGRNSADAFAHHECCDSLDFDLFQGDYADNMEANYVFDDIEDVFDFLEDNFAQPVRLQPPGDCVWSRHDQLQRRVKTACDRPRSCEGRIGCGVLRKRGIRNVQCTNARGAINQECYRGGDPEHRSAKEWQHERPMNAAGCFERGLAGEDNFSIRPVA